jgi:biopolymer transport protein ExbB
MFFWLRLGKRQKKLIPTILDLYNHQSSLTIERLERERDLPIARIFMAAISIPDATPEEFRLAMESEIHAEVPVLRRFTSLFDTVISLAPLLGLLGTVTGLIVSLSSIKIGQAVAASSSTRVETGIAEALISTATGMIVAIIASAFASIFRSLYKRQLAQIQEATTQLELLHRRLWETEKMNNRTDKQALMGTRQY